jgi:hypothetical protein
LIDDDNFYQLGCDVGSFDKKSIRGTFLDRDTKTTALPVKISRTNDETFGYYKYVRPNNENSGF